VPCGCREDDFILKARKERPVFFSLMGGVVPETTGRERTTNQSAGAGAISLAIETRIQNTGIPAVNLAIEDTGSA
jgi:hypothetical protein